mmetsp:Transcript_44768/g.88401  ORF Transcript_44768/g.88401 Transcript_44768/m.88401 type:complete len:106 (-) Transcript_44768:27-344(-)
MKVCMDQLLKPGRANGREKLKRLFNQRGSRSPKQSYAKQGATKRGGNYSGGRVSFFILPRSDNPPTDRQSSNTHRQTDTHADRKTCRQLDRPQKMLGWDGKTELK